MKKIAYLTTAAALLTTINAFAETYTWKGESGNWSDSNWDPAWSPGSDSNAVIGSGRVSVDGDISAGTVSLSDAELWLIGGNRLTAGGISLNEGGKIDFYSGARLDSDIILNGGAVGMRNGNSATMSGKFTGTGDLNMTLIDYSNALVMTGAGNTYTGDTRIINNAIKFSGHSAADFTPFGTDTSKTVYLQAVEAGGNYDGYAGISFNPGDTNAGYTIAQKFDFSAVNGGKANFHNEDGYMGLTGAINISTDANAASAVVFSTKWNGKDIWLEGKVSGSGVVFITDVHNYGGAVHLTNDTNDFAGTYKVGATTGFKIAGDDASSNGGYLVLEAANAAANAKIELGTNGRLTLNGTDATIAGLNGTETSGVINDDGGGRQLTVNNAEANSFAGSVQNIKFAKAGAGDLTLSGTNTLKRLDVSGTGKLTLSGTNTIQVGPLVIQDSAEVVFSGTTTMSGEQFQTTGNGKSPVLTVTGSLTLQGVSYETILGQNSNNHASVLNVADGGVFRQTNHNLFVGNAGGSTNTATVNILNGGVFAFESTGGNIIIGRDGATGTINLNGTSGSVGRLETASQIQFSSGKACFNFDGGELKVLAALPDVFSQAAAPDSGIYVKAGGAIINTNGFDAGINQAIKGDSTSTGGGLTKIGGKVLTLGGVNTYSGATIIEDGTLALGAGGSIANSSGIKVKNAGTVFDVSAVTGGFTLGQTQTLSGNGSVYGNVTIVGTVAPGNSVGTLTLGQSGDTVTISSTGKIIIEIESAISFDKIIAGGDLIFTAGSEIVLAFIGGYVPQLGETYEIFNKETGSVATIVSELSASGFQFEWNDAGTGITVTAVPEPSTYALFGGLAAAGVALVARRRKRG